MSPFLLLLLFSAVVRADRYGAPSRTITYDKAEHHVSRRSPIVIDRTKQSKNMEDPYSHQDDPLSGPRAKRDIQYSGSPANISAKVSRLNDSHSLLMVHWAGEGSDVVLCLARDPILRSLVISKPSALYISYDYGDTFHNKTELLRLSTGGYAIVEKFSNHHKFNTHVVLTDVTNRVIFTTNDNGMTMQQHTLDFHPSDILFDEDDPLTFLVYDKVDILKKLYVTRDFGRTFTLVQESVKSFYWEGGASAAEERRDGDEDADPNARTLYVERLEPSGTSTVLSSNTLFKHRTYKVLIHDVLDFHVKGDFIFASKESMNTSKENDGKVNLDLYVSYKRGPFVKALFLSELSRLRYHIADVSGSQAMVVVVHDTQIANLYVSVDIENIDSSGAKFSLSLENIFCYMPNVTWKDTWLEDVTEEAFSTLTRVEGLRGIYIASVVISPSKNGHIGPENLATVITFDRGGEWQPIQAPKYDDEGNPYKCEMKEEGCSLHLAQNFAHLYPQTRSVPILTSKSAPGIILATGTVGRSLKGHPGVFLSTDAGVTWRQILKDIYFFTFGDHGGVIVAVKYFRSRGETRQILYSTDEGKTFHPYEFSFEFLRMYGLMTEPGGNTTVFTMFGSATDKHQWIIVKVDLKNAFDRNCTEADYKFWSPGTSPSGGTGVHVPCLLGRTETYQRRLPHVNCYNSRNYVRRVKMETCHCSAEDFDCDYGFERHLLHVPQCVRNHSKLFDPYTVPATCRPGQFYNRTKGYRKVPNDVCVRGAEALYLPDELPCPFKEIDDFLLVAQRERIARIDLKSLKLEPLPIHGLKNVIAIEFDMKNNCVYWADIITDTIGRQCLGGKDMPEVLISNNLHSVEGMALDWVSSLLYFVDGAKATIEVIRTDVSHSGRMRRTILKAPILKKPRGIAVHPKAGYLFWSDWTPDGPSVSRSNLDGSNVKRLFQSPKVAWPNGLAIDHIAERLYWVDAREDYISSCNLDGNHVVKVIANDPRVSHPFAVAVFKDNLYWDDWKQNAVFMADKDHGVAIQKLTSQMLGLMDLKVFAHSIQEGKNACSNTSLCSHICVGAPNGGHTCLCPDDMTMEGGRCMCPGGQKPFTNGTCPQVALTCAARYFTCANGLCIPDLWHCDRQDDCGDGSDERNCTQTQCHPKEFRCPDGQCIAHRWRCDKDKDCADGTDEICGRETCNATQFSCQQSGLCIPKSWVCDGENDCHDTSDETGCNQTTQATVCPPGEFKCGNRSQCVPQSWLCDGENDCPDGSDEKDCPSKMCNGTANQFPCLVGGVRTCIPMSYRCDLRSDCDDGADELNCSSYPNTTTVSPVSPSVFVPTQNNTCSEWMFMCNNHRCIPDWWKCDHVNDCGDNSDEAGCGYDESGESDSGEEESLLPHMPRTCSPNYFQCLSGECIPDSWVCDKSIDCAQGEDERNCNGEASCHEDQFKCRIDGSCVSLASVCDGVSQCPDGSDEASCQPDGDGPVSQSCQPGLFPCLDGHCIPATKFCDGTVDCIDGFDEHNCSRNGTRIYQVLQMGIDERNQGSSSLLLYWWISVPSDVVLEYLPSISKVVPPGRRQLAKWTNHTRWITQPEHQFTNLTAYTMYNMTVYVRVKGTKEAFPPAKFITATTGEDIPSEPWNVTAVQLNANEVRVSWQTPLLPHGHILDYSVYMIPPLPPMKSPLVSRETSRIIKYDFEVNTTYSFWVVARNKKSESNHSDVVKLFIDEAAVMESVKKLTAVAQTNNSVTLSWSGVVSADKYEVVVQGPILFFPQLDPFFTPNTTFTVPGLAPGLSYMFKVRAYRKKFAGPTEVCMASTEGIPLPKVSGLVVYVDGTTAKITWDPVQDGRSKEWRYGIYYASTLPDLLTEPKVFSDNTSAVVKDLLPCEKYLFAVGLVGPLGYGPITPLPSNRSVMTAYNRRAAPKHLHVERDIHNITYMIVHWNASCPTLNGNKTRYVVVVTETTLNHSSSITMLPTNDTHIEAHFVVHLGGHYNVTVQTDVDDALVAGPVSYEAPPIPPPHQLTVESSGNGSYVLFWNGDATREQLGPDVYMYEVLVTKGRDCNTSEVKPFLVPSPPFTLTDAQEGVIYCFATRLVTKDGYRSVLSEVRSVEVPVGSWTAAVKSGVVFYTVLPGLVLVLGLLGALAFFVMRHRRLQHSFASFANSHYDTRSGAATFGGADGLEEEDSPVIRGFSDDEPLVIA